MFAVGASLVIGHRLLDITGDHGDVHVLATGVTSNLMNLLKSSI